MNEKAIDQVFQQTRAAVEAAKARGEHEFDFAKLYISLGGITLEMDEKEELKKRFAKEGWNLENQVVLRF